MKFEFLILFSSLAGLINFSCQKLWFVTDHVYMNVLHAREITQGI